MRLFLQSCASFAYKFIVKPILFSIHPDKVHDGMIDFAYASGKNKFFRWFIEYSMKYENPMLEQTLDNFGNLKFINPLGLGAGFDKNALTAIPIEKIGFSYAAFGSTTARNCPGNPRPWFHRLKEYKSLMVNVGLANKGVDVVEKTVHKAYQNSQTLNVGQSIARTNDQLAADDNEGISDYVKSLTVLNGKTAYIEVNISCPNTFKGEPFTDSKRLDALLTKLDEVKPRQPITLKMPSDKTWDEFKELLEVAVKHNVQGVTITNLRKDKESFNIPEGAKGNLSGKPTQAKSDYLVAKTYLAYGDRLVIMGLGGVFNAEDAYQKIKSGATLVSIVSALMFEGPAVVPIIKRGLVKLLKADGYTNISQAIGVDAQKVANADV